MVGHTYNPSTEEAEAGDEEFRSFSATQGNQGYMTSCGMKKGRRGRENGRKGGRRKEQKFEIGIGRLNTY